MEIDLATSVPFVSPTRRYEPSAMATPDTVWASQWMHIPDDWMQAEEDAADNIAYDSPQLERSRTMSGISVARHVPMYCSMKFQT